MRVSKAIQLLPAFLAEHGDLELSARCPFGHAHANYVTFPLDKLREADGTARFCDEPTAHILNEREERGESLELD